MDTLRFEDLPERIENEAALEELLSRPSQPLIDDLRHLDGDLIVLGAGGKVGPTLARLAKRAAPDKRVVGVARFSDRAVRRRLEDWGIETIAADLLDRDAMARLPKLENVVYMAGKKFGTEAEKPFTWAMNTHVPALVADAFRASRIVAFSTLCVYPFADVRHQAVDETTEPGPRGEYAASCVGRERIFQFFSERYGTPGRLIRLNYAIDMRYGVLFDVARWVRNRTPIPLATGHANVVWQGDASSQILRSLRHVTTPASPLNVGGPDATSIRRLARALGARFGVDPVFAGEEAMDAWVNSCAEAERLFGYPLVPLGRMIDWVADWVERDMPAHDKPTRYEVRDGRF